MYDWAALSPWVALVSSALLCLWPLAAHAQDINPDRPDLTSSAELVPAGSVQIETGIEYERARVGGGPTQQQLSTQAVLRAGLSSVLEVSLEGEPFVWQRADRDASGSGDYTLGLKYRLHTPPEAGGGPLLSVKPFVKLPVARAPIGSERLDVGALLLLTIGLPWGLSLDANAGAAAIGQRTSATTARASARRSRCSTSSPRAWPSTSGCARRSPAPDPTGRPSSG